MKQRVGLAMVFAFFLANILQAQVLPFKQQKVDLSKQIGQNLPTIYKAIGEQKLLNAQTRSFAVDTILNLPTDARVSGQFEETQAVAITWGYNYIIDSANYTFYYTDPGDESSPDGNISIQLADAIQANAKVLIRIRDWADSVTIKNIMANNGRTLTNYAFYQNEIDSWWDRDSGPISFYYSNNDSIGMVDMDYYTIEAFEDSTGFLYTDYNVINAGGRIHDDSIPIALGQYFNYPVFKTSLNNEGGNLIFDGIENVWTSTRTREQNVGYHGAFMFDSTGAVLIDPNGNYLLDTTVKIYENYPPIDDAGYENLMLTSFNAQKMVEPETFVCDGGTGHVDIYLKLLNENTVGVVDYASAVNHTDFTAWNDNLVKLQNETDAFGKPLTLQILPMPPTANGTVQTDCEFDQRTYINGIFVNKTFIMPIMSNPNNMTVKDAEAIANFQKAFPGYAVTPIDVTSMYGYGGALHCITMQIPAENPIYIKHDALSGSVPLSTAYPMQAFVKNKSGMASTIIYHKKVGSTTWNNEILTVTTGNNYAGNIDATSYIQGDTIEYFIEGISNNGKTISKPFCAREGGANKFVIDGAIGIDQGNTSTNFVLTAYPNPSSSNVTIPVSIDKQRQVAITITDLLGKVIYTKNTTFEQGLHLITLANQEVFTSTGVYLITTTIDSVPAKTQKLVVQ